MSFVPMVNSTIERGRKNKSRGLCPGSGSEWSKVRRLLQKKESFTFLDRLHDQLGQLSLPEDIA